MRALAIAASISIAGCAQILGIPQPAETADAAMTPDVPPGTPDAPPGTPDARIVDGRPDASPPDATACVNPPTGLVSWWQGENSLIDSQGGNDLTAMGTGVISYAPGLVGQAIHFTSGAYATGGTAGFPTGSGARTMEAWVRMGQNYNVNNQGGLFGGYGTWGSLSGTFELLVWFSPANQLDFSQWGAGLADPTAGTANTWIHMAVTYDGSTVKLYVNGAAVDSSSSIAVNTATGTKSYLGGFPSPPDGKTEWLVGDVDEFSIYSRALSAGEIQSIYEAGAAGKCH